MADQNWVFDVSTRFGKVSVEVHPGPHTDELLAILMISHAATKEFVEKHEGETIGLGVEGGPYDEHPNSGQSRKDGECTATLVAKALGIYEHPAWRRLLRYAFWVDQGEPIPRLEDEGEKAYPEEWNHVFDVNNWLKCRWRQLVKANGIVPIDDGLKYVTFGLDMLRVFFYQQIEFIRAWEEIKKAGRKLIVQNQGREVSVLLINSDSSEINAAARHFDRADLVIKRGSRGHVQVFRNKQCRVGMDDLAQVLVVEECHRRGEDFAGNWEDLRKEGEDPTGVWYYYRPHGMILNGSEQHQRQPTAIADDDELLRLVEIALSSDFKHSPFASVCMEGVCSDSSTAPCPLFQYGLGRCRKVRYEERRRSRS
jgi:hypothetical protein